jgi:hypothetical protein
MEMYTVPEGLVQFIKDEFLRFNAPIPRWEVIEIVSRNVIKYVIHNKYFPVSVDEAIRRYREPGLTHPEKVPLIGSSEIQLAYKIGNKTDVNTLHLTAWAALLWCWSEESAGYLSWYCKTTDITLTKAKLSLPELPMEENGF